MSSADRPVSATRAVPGPEHVKPPFVRQSFCGACFWCASYVPSLWLDLAEGRLRLDRLAATAALRLSSPGGPPHATGRAGAPARPFPASQENLTAPLPRRPPAP